MKYDVWEAPPPPGAGAQPLSLVERVLAARGIVGPDAAREFLRTDEGLLHDPMELKDLPEAARRLERAMERGETIAVYGDYDVDGVTSTCLLYHFFRARGAKVLTYIPRRLEEGYGLNRAGLDALAAQGARVVVTVDCGITAVEEVEYAKSLGLEVIVTDHHACKETLPHAAAVVDPHRPDCAYPFQGLAGVGVALKLAMAMGAELADYADLAALGTVADVMPLVDENRAMVAIGLERINTAPRPGIRALLEAAGAGQAANAVTLGYTLAPRLNAAGRLGVTQVALDLLLAETEEQAVPLAQELCELNRRRQALEGEIFDACVGRVETEAAEDQAIVLSGEGWHQGVVGIVASRLADRFQKPAFMISLQDGMGKGSCRSVGDLSLFQALQEAQDLLEGFGGHAMAAGFTVKEENIPALRERLNRWVGANGGREALSTLHVDVALPDAEALTPQAVEELERLEPYGAGNPKPVFTLPRVALVGKNLVGAEGKHMRLSLRCKAQRLPGIFFSCPKEGWEFQEEDRVDVAFTPQINEFRGKRGVQLVVQDLRLTPCSYQRDRGLLRKYQDGRPLAPDEAARLIPSREEFESLWRYLRARGGELTDTLGALARGSARQSGAEESLCRTRIALEVFAERGLITLSQRREDVRLALLPRGAKVDLEASPVLIRLRAQAGENGAPNAGHPMGESAPKEG